jgi:hypothetical protein
VEASAVDVDEEGDLDVVLAQLWEARRVTTEPGGQRRAADGPPGCSPRCWIPVCCGRACSGTPCSRSPWTGSTGPEPDDESSADAGEADSHIWDVASADPWGSPPGGPGWTDEPPFYAPLTTRVSRRPHARSTRHLTATTHNRRERYHAGRAVLSVVKPTCRRATRGRASLTYQARRRSGERRTFIGHFRGQSIRTCTPRRGLVARIRPVLPGEGSAPEHSRREPSHSILSNEGAEPSTYLHGDRPQLPAESAWRHER